MEERFERSYDSLATIFTFVEAYADGIGLERDTMLEVNLAIEEIFTNMVKYSKESSQPIAIGLATCGDRIEVTIIDQGVEPFDVTRSDSDDMEAALKQRASGGRGLFLVKQLMDTVTYEYDEARRRSRIKMTRALEK